MSATGGSGFAFQPPVREGGGFAVDLTVPADLRYLEGHFPGHPMVPGVAQVVALAEAQARAAWPELGAVESLRRLKFREALRPGDELRLTLSRDGETVRFSIARGDTPCTEGRLVFRA